MNEVSRIPNPIIGYLFPIIFLVYEFSEYGATDDLIIGISIVIMAWLYFIWNVYVMHKGVQSKFNYKYSITPLSAALRHFIPLYNAFWLYKWPNELESFIDSQINKPFFKIKKIHTFMIVGLALNRYDFAIGFAVFWYGFSLMTRQLNQLFDMTVLPVANSSAYLQEQWSNDIINNLKIPDSKR